MGGNVGLQSSTAVVRGMATGTITHGRVLRVVAAESATGGLLGIVCGAVTGLMSYWLEFRNVQIGAISGIVALSMFTSVTIAATIGTLIPFMLHRMKKDPAIASGPFITAFNDLLNVTIYLTLATLLLTKVK
jgi:magnesium transporter